ncbi:hypothetical protein [Sandaracinus amylolyticus]|uniref:hypothetical protein n=1 Tax=Sandaracinus amylolyticus TaxID=927083 RepID=UPI001F21BCC6|nr:hypothetical protein [Sandaracinus amylolyticus]UJR82245.1 Hypothetical protein I5071_43100 [Sandaracinus amylolyticus]
MATRSGWSIGVGALVLGACVGEISGTLPGDPQSGFDAGARDAAIVAPIDAARSAPGDAGDDGPPGDSGPDAVVDASAPAEGGIPCEVVAVLAPCVGCHASTPVGGAPMPLVAYDHLVAPSRFAGLTIAALSAQRMRDDARPMPPAPAPRVADLTALDDWLAAGAPREECVDPGPGPTDPFDTPEVCTSGTFWTSGDNGSSQMHPGAACIACHTSRGDGPRLTIAGTVFPSAHEPTDCNGLAGSADEPLVVEITDANGVVTTIQANGVGNFRSSTAIAAPYTARVRYQGRERAMGTPQRNGDCNGCHTLDGLNGAPGRIVAP